MPRRAHVPGTDAPVGRPANRAGSPGTDAGAAPRTHGPAPLQCSSEQIVMNHAPTGRPPNTCSAMPLAGRGQFRRPPPELPAWAAGVLRAEHSNLVLRLLEERVQLMDLAPARDQLSLQDGEDLLVQLYFRRRGTAACRQLFL